MIRFLLIAAVVVGGLAGGCDRKKDVPANDGLQGVEIGELTSYPTRSGVPFWVSSSHPAPFPIDYATSAEPRDAVLQTVGDAVAQALRIAKQTNPEWTSKLPPLSEFHIYMVKPMAFTEDGLPALVVTPKDAQGRPIGQPTKTAGTVFNTKERIVVTAGSLTNPFIVLPYQEKWDRLDYLFNQVWFESEHLIERWVSYSEFAKFAGANDAHPHRPDPTPTLFERTPIVYTESYVYSDYEIRRPR